MSEKERNPNWALAIAFFGMMISAGTFVVMVLRWGSDQSRENDREQDKQIHILSDRVSRIEGEMGAKE